MRFLRGTILAIGLMSFAVACGGSKQEPVEPVAPTTEEPAEDTMGGDETGGGEEANPCAEGAEGADPCGGGVE